MSEKGKLYQQINNIEEYHLGGIPPNEVIKVLDEAKKEYLAIPKKVSKERHRQEKDDTKYFLTPEDELTKEYELEWFKKWFGKP